MLVKKQTSLFFLFLLLAGFPGYAQIKGSLWDTKPIYKVPACKILSKDSVQALVYDGLPYKGHRNKVFAYYCSPGMLSGKSAEDRNLPAVVLVHGGGGMAFKQWAILWAKKGYAAIAMDLRGNDGNRKHIEGGFEEPDNLTPYFTITNNREEQWMYQAVADVILAHNLIRSFKEVDSSRTALTGISWGGIISNVLAGVDNRYKAVVPVYGCGFLFENSAMRKDLDKLNDSDRSTWIRQYDPSQYIGRASMPVLFINGTNDGNFFLDSYAKTYDKVKNKSLSIKIGLKHNHAHGWGNQEIYTFINRYLNGTPGLARLAAPEITSTGIKARFTSQLPVQKAFLNYTKDTTSILMNRKWQSIAVTIRNNEVVVPVLPTGLTIWYLSLTDERGMQVSGELQWSIKKPVSMEADEIYAGRYKAVFNTSPKHTPSSKTPDGPLAGNGDIGLTLGGTSDKLRFYIGKNDFWRAYPVYPGGGIASPGFLEMNIKDLEGGNYYAEELLDSALIKGRFSTSKLDFSLNTWVSATANTIVVELNANQATTVALKLKATAGNTSISHYGKTGDVIWVTRSFENSPLLNWPAHIAMALKVTGGTLEQNGTLRLKAGQKTWVSITIYTNQDCQDWKERSIQEAGAMNESAVQQLKSAHLQWWRDFWNRSRISIGDTTLEKYYYASQYLFASSSRKGKFSPGIWGPFVTRDSTSWGGDYHLNYNYQAPYWAAYSSNYIDLTDNFDQPLLDYVEKGKRHAKELLGIRGIYYPVGIGPKGLVTTRWPLSPQEMLKRYGTTDNTIDGGYKFLGQKINAVFSAGNMLMRFYSTYDEDYVRKVYPYLLECANFWEDYLKYENGKYAIYMDHYGEVMPNLRNKGIWKDQLGDFNSTLSLGLVKMLFKGIADMSDFLHKDQQRQAKWVEIRDHISPFPLGEKEGRMSLKSVEKSPASWHQGVMGLSRVSIHGLILPGGVCGPVTDSAFNQILLQDVAHWKDKSKEAGDWGNTLGNGIETCFPAAVRVGYPSDEIMGYLKERIARQSLPNLWITADGGGLETLAAVPLTINEMLLQSYEGVIRIFPNWNRNKSASFHKLRAYGAFVISSSLDKGKIEEVQICSEKGRDCILENPWPGQHFQVIRNGVKGEQVYGKRIVLPTAAQEELLLKPLL